MRTILDFPKPTTRKQVVADRRATEKLVSPFGENALNAASQTILIEYRYLMALAQNI